jgi:hypothetical protein
VTVSASATCGNQVPPDVRVRTYDARIAQQGMVVDVTFTSATLEDAAGRNGVVRSSRGTVLDGSIEFGAGVNVPGDEYWGSLPPMFDRLTVGGFAGWMGWAHGSMTGSTMTLQMSGWVTFWQSPAASQPAASCFAADHRLAFEKKS